MIVSSFVHREAGSTDSLNAECSMSHGIDTPHGRHDSPDNQHDTTRSVLGCMDCNGPVEDLVSSGYRYRVNSDTDHFKGNRGFCTRNIVLRLDTHCDLFHKNSVYTPYFKDGRNSFTPLGGTIRYIRKIDFWPDFAHTPMAFLLV